MKKNTKIIYITEIILFIYIIYGFLFINRLSYENRLFSALIVLLFTLVVLLTFFGFRNDKNYLKGSSARFVTTCLMSYMLIIYGLGIILGFTRGYVYSGLLDFLKTIVPIIIINIEVELLRYLVAKNSFKNKIPLVLFTIVCSFVSILLEINLGVLTSTEEKFIFLSTIILPIFAEEVLCSYMTYKISLLPSLIYKLTIRLYIYLFPIIPNLGNYIYSVANIVLPFVLYGVLNKMIIRYEKEKQQLKRINRIVFTIPLGIFLLLLVLLISGISKYKLIAIASDSMSPTYSRGDAVIYEKVNVKDLEVGDVLAFQKNNIVVTHRITEIWKKNGKYYFTTKGDNNDVIDDFKTVEDNALGKVRTVFKYIGFPTVLVNEFFGKE